MASGGLPRLHGDETLHDPNLVEEGCTHCKKATTWRTEKQPDGTTIKTCTACGAKTFSKPATKENVIEKKEGLLEKLASLLPAKK
jgi:NAD-dependent SIR2 family protein deacetylase